MNIQILESVLIIKKLYNQNRSLTVNLLKIELVQKIKKFKIKRFIKTVKMIYLY
jgi:hypothetical protein